MEEEEETSLFVSSLTIQESQQMTPSTPAPSEDRFFYRLEKCKKEISSCENATSKYFGERKDGKKLIKLQYQHPNLDLNQLRWVSQIIPLMKISLDTNYLA